MALETGTYISDLVPTNPTSTDQKSAGDDHLRLIKSTIQTTLPNLTGAVTSTHTELNLLDGVTATTAEINILDGVTSTAAEINILDGATLTVAELNRLAGITGPASAKDGEIYTGAHDFTGATVTVADQAFGASGDAPANLDFVNAVSMASVLPAQTGNAGKIINTDGANATWEATLNTTVVDLIDGTDATKKLALDLTGITTATTRTVTIPDATTTMVGTNIAQTLTLKTLTNPIINVSDNDFTIEDNTDATKVIDFELSGITTGTTRTLTVADNDIIIDTPYGRLLSVTTGSATAEVDLDTVFTSTYDDYIITFENLVPVTNNTTLNCVFTVGGTKVTTAVYADNGTLARLTGQTSIRIASTLSNDTSGETKGVIRLSRPSQTGKAKTIRFEGTAYITDNLPQDFYGSGGTTNPHTGALTKIHLSMSSGNISSITVKIFGVRKAI